jgi:hypothetical protein
MSLPDHEHPNNEGPSAIYGGVVDDFRLDVAIHARLALANLVSESSEDKPGSVKSTRTSTSSMRPALIHEPPYIAHPPSLRDNYSSATPTETSISTGLASHISGVPLLEDNNGVLETPRDTTHPTILECTFWFLSCAYLAHGHHVEEWKTHCLSHFRGEEPPNKVQCPLCEWELQHESGWQAWLVYPTNTSKVSRTEDLSIH